MSRFISFICCVVMVSAQATSESSEYCKNVPEKSTRDFVYKDCGDAKRNGEVKSGIQRICPKSLSGVVSCFDVYCDMETDDGGWLVFQRRNDGSFDFYREWQSYKDGFGRLSGEMWLGNEKLFWITSQGDYELRVDMTDDRNESRYAKYDHFFLNDEYERYRLNIGKYSGNAGDSLTRHNKWYFSTKDNDTTKAGCTKLYKGAWWYDACHGSNLNGLYLKGNHTSYADGVNWRYFRGYHSSLIFTEMKIRPKS